MYGMSVRHWQRPGWLAIALALLGVVLFMRLGIWQLDRAAKAQQLFDAFADATQAGAEDFATVRDAPPANRYPHVQVRGHFVADRGYLRDEQVREGKLGVEAYAVFTPQDSASSLLVDRGWIVKLQSAQPSLPPLPVGEIELSGVYAPFPGNGLRVGGNALQTQTTWPKLTLAIDAQEIGQDLGQPLLPRVLLLDVQAGSGFVREWTPNMMSPQRHQAYAFQWFAFAIAALVIFILLHYKKVQK